MAPLGLSRREALACILGAPVAACMHREAAPRLPPGSMLGAAVQLGHRLRDGDGMPQPGPDAWHTVEGVVVGAGVAGLSAAWQLRRDGLQAGRDFVVLELEQAVGGTARSGQSATGGYPWGAHYLPAPLHTNPDLVALLAEMGMVEGVDAQGDPQIDEAVLCRDPEERVFYQGCWYEGLYLYAGASPQDLAELAAFQRQVQQWVAFRDAAGRRAFTIPVAACSQDVRCTDLDKITCTQWLRAQGWTSPRLHWLMNYACRDDYGTHMDHTSAWAGLFYFASRVPRPGADSRPIMTWPAGNGRLVQHLSQGVPVQRDTLVVDVLPQAQGVQVLALADGGRRAVGYRARWVIFAAPQFVAKRVLRPWRSAPPSHIDSLEHGSWVVANLHLRQRPRETGFPLAWDNVLYDSPSLGYVVNTHQLDRSRGPCVLTYYHPVVERDARAARQKLLHLDHSHWAEAVLRDLRRAHPDLPGAVERLDVMRWGHAMVRPLPGVLWGPGRQAAAQPYRNVHFAHSELSGMALFEEAFYHGLRAARAVVARKA